MAAFPQNINLNHQTQLVKRKCAKCWYLIWIKISCDFISKFVLSKIMSLVSMIVISTAPWEDYPNDLNLPLLSQ